MKIDRLIGILSVLLQEKKVTAPELAEKVSFLTIFGQSKYTATKSTKCREALQLS